VSSARLRALRDAFDASFAAAEAARQDPSFHGLAVRLGGDPYALPLRALSGIVGDARLSPLPSPVPAFLGVAGLAGRPVPVFDLRRLLGYRPAAPPGGIVLVNAPEPLGLAVDALEGQFAAEEEALDQAATGPRLVSGAVRHGRLVRPVVDVAQVIAAVRRHSGSPGSAGET
jgi:chemotaxis signal transduction protein